jgi:hypothetical protein
MDLTSLPTKLSVKVNQKIDALLEENPNDGKTTFSSVRDFKNMIFHSGSFLVKTVAVIIIAVGLPIAVYLATSSESPLRRNYAKELPFSSPTVSPSPSPTASPHPRPLQYR